jgi:Family of unknown function (DUF6297)
MTGRQSSAATEREVLSYVRFRRKQRSRRRTSDRLLNIYMGLFVAFYVITGVSGLLDTDWVPKPGSFLDTIIWLPLVLFGVVWGVLRFATWQGPVLFSGPELQWVMSAPLNRRDLVWMRLRRALLIATVSGVVGGAIVGIFADVLLAQGSVAVFVAATLAFAALGLMATALSWHVERSARWSTLVNRVVPLVLVVAALLAWAAANGRDTALWWSGPWGWATGPLVAVAGWSVPGWVLQATLLGVATVGALVLAVAATARFSEEELWRRADARSSAAAALFLGDVRRLKLIARRDRARGRFRGRGAQMVRLPRPWLAIASRDLLALRRSPGVVVTAAIFVAAGFVAAVAATDRPILVVVTFIALYLAGSRMLEPIRIEVDQPDAHWILPWPWGTVLVLHCIVPATVLTVLGWIGLAVVGIGGFVDSTAIWPLVLVTPFAAAALVTPAAISAARRPFPIESLISGADSSGGFYLLIWLLAGPVLAALAVNIAFGSLRKGLDQGINGSTTSAIVILAGFTAAFVAWLWTRKPPD